ncbi:related to ROG1 Protein with putative serine active lipase domain [Rhynchosporium secalis]|uniref:Related to ROG1 Protein with putative serine active lipase domain n=1 Tax=Rhynchosporium secalis TaxID=38038 RepID=A0A1E1LUK3_RHYSE|nr:related to ROG1 Protein with putative serine active lipase domain [Rhynchosporium secalis]
MLLLHQTGSVKIGEVVRYTVTYTPAHDRILPSPHVLHLKIKNTSAIALRAAFVHGPYTLYAAAYPANFHPNSKFESPRIYGVPEFEPNLKAGGNFTVKLNVPESVRESAGKGRSPVREGHAEGTIHAEEDTKSVRWIIEVSSQVIFSNSAAVHYEILLGRDEKSLALGFASSLTSTGNGPQSQPGHVSDHQHGAGGPRDGHGHIHAHHSALAKGVFSKSIKVKVDDTASLWNTPRMPEWDDVEDDVAGDARNEGKEGMEKPVVQANARDGEGHRTKRQKRIHLVVLTHGLHSNLGADMLFLKESIDEAAKQAKADARIRKAKKKEWNESAQTVNAGGDPAADTVENHEAESDDEEEVVVRGFSGNAVRTERGIKYLGKRLAKYVLQMTYPDQPYKPVTKKSTVEALSHAIKPDRPSVKTTSKEPGQPTHEHSSIIKAPATENKLAYKITSISFIAHSLGGLVQTYAVAYIQKHSPEFFDKIEPINFISLASPFLGLSNENPMYVKFALDFGLVGRTGQDLGLTWRAPTIARSGWGAIVGGIGESAQKKIDRESAPESKPLLRILPTGPAHVVLKKFRNRTIYSNVVNDGVVPLRTSCLLFLDWQGLGRVEKARRDNGLVGTMASWGWAELTGANSSAPAGRKLSENYSSDAEETGRNTPTKQGHGGDVPQPSPYAMDDDARSMKSLERSVSAGTRPPSTSAPSESKGNDGPLASIMKFFQPTAQSAPKPHNDHPKHTKIYKRSQTLQMGSDSSFTPPISKQESSPKKASGKATTGEENGDADRLSAPPKTTFFESAGDIIKPPLPPTDFLIDPSSRPRTIFHDRVYHPEDIPPPPLKKRPTGSMMLRRRSSLQTSDSISPPSPNVPHTDSSLSTHDYDDTRHTNPGKDPRDVIDGSAMKVEEKIARAYHRDISWRKVLVRLEPDAHNNIIVRRMFANAYGWPVVKHLCDTHFADSEAAQTRDEDESNAERAKGEHEKVGKDGGEVNYSPREHNGDGKTPRQLTEADRTESERREATDALPSLPASSKSGSLAKALAGPGGGSLNVPISSRSGPVSSSGYESDTAWSERDWADSEFDSDDPETASSPGGGGDKEKEKGKRSSSGAKHGTEGWNWTEAIAGRGVGPSSPKGTDMAEIDRFLAKGKGKGKEEGTGK